MVQNQFVVKIKSFRIDNAISTFNDRALFMIHHLFTQYNKMGRAEGQMSIYPTPPIL